MWSSVPDGPQANVPAITKPANTLLAALPAHELARMLPQMREVPLNFAQAIHEQNEVVEQIAFTQISIGKIDRNLVNEFLEVLRE